MTTPGRHAQPREWPLLRAWLNTRWRVTDVAVDVRWYAAKTTRALKRAAVRWRHRDDDNDVPRPGHGAQGEPATGCGEPDETAAPGRVDCYFCDAWAVTVVFKPWKVGGWVDVCLAHSENVPRPDTGSVATGEATGGYRSHAPGNLAQVGPGHFGRPHVSGSVHDEPVWYQPHAAPDIPQGFWSPPALRDWLPELLEWALTAPIGEIRAAAA